MKRDDAAATDAATGRLRELQARDAETKKAAVDVIRKASPEADRSDTNYVFLTYVMQNLPTGVVGLLLAAIFCAAMSATASGLNSLASTTVVDIWKRLLWKNGSDHHYVRISKLMTIFWGLFCIGFASYASQLGSLIEAVNKLGSFFYGTILAIFLLAFYTKVNGTSAFLGAVIGQIAVALCATFTDTAWLWWNVVGCVVGVIAALVIQAVHPRKTAPA